MTRSLVLAYALWAAMGVGMPEALAGIIPFSDSSSDPAASATSVSSDHTLNIVWNFENPGTIVTLADLPRVATPSDSALVSPATSAGIFGVYGFDAISGAPVSNDNDTDGTGNFPLPAAYSAPVPSAIWDGGSMLALLGARRMFRKL